MAKGKVIKTRNAGTMTESQYHQKLRYTLRKAFRWWKPMQMALKAVSRPSQSKNKRLKFEYQCAKCKKWFPRTHVEIDHVIPCGSLKTLEDIPGFIQRMTPESPDAFQVLCKKDHLKKTKEEQVKSK